jgi:hypothetical protein
MSMMMSQCTMKKLSQNCQQLTVQTGSLFAMVTHSFNCFCLFLMERENKTTLIANTLAICSSSFRRVMSTSARRF